MHSDYENLIKTDRFTVRSAIRAGEYKSHTAGLAQGFLQTNIAIMPEYAALDFMRFCQRNPKPCPVSGVSDTGNPILHTLGADIDIRTDVPAYNIYRNGVLAESTFDIKDIWQDDLVAFALGCSFTFEHALMRAGIPVWHVENNKTVPMFRSSLQTVPAGMFSGQMVVSMRAIHEKDLEAVEEISSRYPAAHGRPVHVGNPSQIGITDLGRPDWGDPAPVGDGQVPVFWACGVTPQVALETAKLPIFIAHKPGHMLITDVPESAECTVLPASSSA